MQTKLSTRFLIVFGVCAVLILVLVPTSAKAFSVTTGPMSVNYFNDSGTCSSSQIQTYIPYADFSDNDDGGGHDGMVYAVLDGTGAAFVFADFELLNSNSPSTVTFSHSLAGITARPVTAVVFDKPSTSATPGADVAARYAYALANYSLEAQATADPVDLGIASCAVLPLIASGASGGSKTKVVPYTGIYLMSAADQAPYLSVPDAAGNLACGVFDVNGWGAKYVGLADFLGCTAPVTVKCFSGDGEWTADTVSGVVMHGDWEVDFISHQDGTCGLFPSS